MQIEEAIKILNERRHNACADWFIAAHDVVHEKRFDELELTFFEAIAIAVYYKRERILEDPAIKNTQICLEADALERLHNRFNALMDAYPLAGLPSTVDQALTLILEAFIEGKKVGAYPEMEQQFRYEKGEASKLNAPDERVEVSRLYCKKHPKATFEIREVNLVGMPAIGHVFACTCFCGACTDSFVVSITEDLFWTIVQGGVKNWSAAPPAVAQANTQINDYYKENVDVDPS